MDKESSLRIQLMHGLSRHVQVEVQHGRIDVGIVVNPIASPDLIIRTLATDEFCIWQGNDLKTQKLKLFCNLA
jgi:DNA-binding transcriptional LysR family regulator